MDGGKFKSDFAARNKSLTHVHARHLMTATGAYFYLVWGIWLRHCLNGRQEEYDLKWPRVFSLPEIVHSKRVPNSRRETDSRKLQ